MWRKKGSISAIITFAQIFILAIIITLSHTGARAKAAGSIDITGTVNNSSGVGVSNVSVYATDPGTNNVDFGPITTGSDGSYDLQVSAGTYDFHYVPSSGSGLTPVVESNVTVLSDQTINVQFTPAPPTFYTFSGTLTDANGNPISGAALELVCNIAACNSGNDYLAYSDSNGNFTMSGVQPGEYNQVQVSNTGSAAAGNLYFTPSNGGFFDLTNGNLTQNIQTVVGTNTLTVQTNDSNGNPLSGLTVNAQGSSLTPVVSGNLSESFSSYSQGTTDSNGSVTFTVDQGEFFDENSITSSAGNPPQYFHNTTPITVNGPSTVVIQAPAPPTFYTFSGTLTDANGNPISGAALELVCNIAACNSGNDYLAYSDSNGNFTMSGVQPGEYNQVQVSNTGSAAAGNLYFTPSNGGFFDLTNGNLTQNIQTVVGTNTLTVQTNDSNGNPLSGLTVNAQGSSLTPVVSGNLSESFSSYSQGTTDSNGSVTFTVDQGEFFDENSITSSAGNPPQYFHNTTPITVNGPSTVVIQAPAPPTFYTFSGTLTDANGNPISGAALELVCNIAACNSGNDYLAYSDSNGNFTMSGVQPGEYNQVQVSNTGSAAAGNLYFTPSNGGFFDLTNGNLTQNIQTVVGTNTLTVQTNDSNGNPLSGLTVNAQGSSLTPVVSGNLSESFSSYSQGTTDSNGSVTFTVDQGEFFDENSITSSAGNPPQYFHNTTPITVNGPSTVVIQAPAPPTFYTFSGTLTDANGNPISGAALELVCNIAACNSGNDYLAYSDSNGNFTMSGVQPGEYNQVQVSNTGSAAAGNLYFTPSNGGFFDLTNGNLTQNIQTVVGTNTLTVQTNDSNGNPLSGLTVNAQGSSLTPVVSGNLSESFSSYSQGTTDSNGSVTFTVDQGEFFDENSITSSAGNPPQYFHNTTPITVNGPSTVVIQASPSTIPPTITSSPTTTTGTTNFPYSFTVTTTGTPAPSITQTGTLPPGLAFTDNGNGTATITGTPSVLDHGSYPVTVTATNSAGSVNQTLTITVPPAFTSSNSDTEVFGTAVNFPITTTGFSSYATIKRLEGDGQLPPGLSLTYNGNGTATISGTPNNSANGQYSFTLSATNNVGSPVTQVFTMTITKAPVFKLVRTSQEASVVGTPYSLTITASGYGSPSLSESGTLPSGLTFHDNGNGTATISGTPAVGSGGAYPFTVTATNSYGTTTDNLTIKNAEAPTITSTNNATATPGSAFYFAVTSTGYPAASYSLTGTLPNGIHFYPGPGTFGGTPNSNDTPGTYNLTLTASNGQGSKSQSFSLTVL